MTLAVAFDLRPDEMLYSAIARYSDAMRYPRQRAVLAAAFGQGAGVAVADLPGRLEMLVRELPPGHRWTAGELAQRHTLLPYYAWCVPRERAAVAFRMQAAADGRTLHERLGIRASTVPTPSHLRYCPTCVAADRATYGSAHWRRAHQPPGVYVCPDHDVLLRVSAARRTRAASRLAYQTADRCISADDPSALPAGRPAAWGAAAADRLRAIACDTAWLLTYVDPVTPQGQASEFSPPGLARLWACCHRALTAAGFVRASGRLRLAELRDAFLAHHGRPLLDTLGCTLRTSRTGDDWLARLVRPPRVAQHPLHHLLVLHVLGVSAADTIVDLDTGRARGHTLALPTPAPDTGVLISIEPNAPVCAGEATGRSSDRPGADNLRRLPGLVRDRMCDRRWEHAWDQRLRTLVRDPSVSLREIGRRLGVTPKTVQRHARRLGVWRAEWRTWARSGRGAARRAGVMTTRRRHRAMWQRLRQAHPAWSAACLRRAVPTTFSYLYRYDRAWLTAHSPAPARRRAPRARVDWAARDAAFRGAAERAVRAMLNSDARPVRLQLTTIARQIGCSHLLASRRNRLPMTAAYLDTVIETRIAFAARRIWWAIERFALAGRVPARWTLTRLAGLRPELVVALSAFVSRTLAVLRVVVNATLARQVAGLDHERSRPPVCIGAA